MKYGIEVFPDVEQLAVRSELHGIFADYESLISLVNSLWSYLSRELTLDQWTGLISLSEEFGADNIGTSHFFRLYNLCSEAKAAESFGNFGGDKDRRMRERLLLWGA